MLSDLRFALRALARQPGLTLVAVLSLGLGIGANTTVFTWLRAFVLNPLPAVRDYDRLGLLRTRAPGGGTWSVSYPDFRDWREQSRTLDIAAAHFEQLGMRVPASGPADAGTERVWANLVSDNYFTVLGLPPALGRAFQRGEEQEDAQVAVLGWSFWQRRFHGDSAIVGRTVVLNGNPFTVVGVAPPRFGGTIVGLGMDMFLPVTTRNALRHEAGAQWRTRRGWQWLDGVARLKPGVTFAQAQGEIDRVAKAAGRAAGDPDHQGAVLRHMDEEGATSWLKPVFSALLGITAVVLLIACANVANLLLARAAGRRREIAVRLAVGAGRGRLIRQLLTESLVLAGLAGGLGLVIALWGRDLLNAFIPAAPFPIGLEFRVDAPVLLFALAVTVATALVFGLAPALQASRPALVPSLKDDVSGAFGGRHRLQGALVVGQVALSLVSLVCAGLFVRSLLQARVVDVGFEDPGHVLLISTDFKLANIPDSTAGAVSDALLAKIRAVPGVRVAAIADEIPLGFGGGGSSSADIEGYQPHPNENMSIRTNYVSTGYFEAMKIPLLQGRTTQDGDERSGARNLVVNQAFARKYFANGDAIGRWVDQGGGRMTIVGVVKTGKYSQLTEDPEPYLYQAVGRLRPPDDFTVVIRTTGDPTALVPSLRRAFEATSPDLPFLDVRTMEQSMQAAVFVQRIGAYMLAGFGAMALLLSAIGLYGVMAYTVSQRTREIGVRVALGAARRDVLRLVMGRALRLAGLGLAIGLAAAAGIARLLRAQLFGISATDPATFIAIALLLGAVALIAGWLPARRAARVDPMIALRYE